MKVYLNRKDYGYFNSGEKVAAYTVPFGDELMPMFILSAEVLDHINNHTVVIEKKC